MGWTCLKSAREVATVASSMKACKELHVAGRARSTLQNHQLFQPSFHQLKQIQSISTDLEILTIADLDLSIPEAS